MKVLFYPDTLVKRGGKSLTQHAFEQLGYEITTDINSDWDFAIYWNFQSKSDVPTELKGKVINIKCNDVLKDKVERVNSNVFGYSSEANTNRYGVAVKKNINQSHKDFSIIFTPCENENGYIYQKFINNRIAIDKVRDFRFFFAFGEYIFTVKDKDLAGAFVQQWGKSEVILGNNVNEYFENAEVEKIKEVVKRMGLDLGAVDVVRDHSDYKLYVIDINNIPGMAPIEITPPVMQAFIKLVKENIEKWLNR